MGPRPRALAGDIHLPFYFVERAVRMAVRRRAPAPRAAARGPVARRNLIPTAGGISIGFVMVCEKQNRAASQISLTESNRHISNRPRRASAPGHTRVKRPADPGAGPARAHPSSCQMHGPISVAQPTHCTLRSHFWCPNRSSLRTRTARACRWAPQSFSPMPRRRLPRAISACRSSVFARKACLAR